MGRIYTGSVSAVAVTAVQDIFELLTPSDMVAAIHRLKIWQTSDVGDAAEEILDVLVNRVTGAPTSGLGGTTPTPRPHDQGDAASTCTLEANNTTQISGGTAVTLDVLAFNIRVGLDHIWTPEERIIISPATRLVVDLNTAPADSITLSASLTFEEIGG